MDVLLRLVIPPFVENWPEILALLIPQTVELRLDRMLCDYHHLYQFVSSLSLCLYFDGNSFARLPSPPFNGGCNGVHWHSERSLLQLIVSAIFYGGHFVSADCGSTLIRSNQTKISINISCYAHIDLWAADSPALQPPRMLRERASFVRLGPLIVGFDRHGLLNL